MILLSWIFLVNCVKVKRDVSIVTRPLSPSPNEETRHKGPLAHSIETVMPTFLLLSRVLKTVGG